MYLFVNGELGFPTICPYAWFSIMMIHTWSRCGTPPGTAPSPARAGLAARAQIPPNVARALNVEVHRRFMHSSFAAQPGGARIGATLGGACERGAKDAES